MTFDGFTIDTVCGQDSTTITPPTLTFQTHDSDSSQFSLTETFTNSNDNCPLTSVSLDGAAEAAGFSIASNGGEYTLTLS